MAVRYPLDRQKWLVWHYTNKTVPSSKFWQRSHESILCLWKSTRPNLNIDPIREEYTEHYKRVIGTTRKNTRSRFNQNGKHSKPTIYNGHQNGALPRDVLKVPALAGGAGFRERWFLCRDCGNRVYPPAELREHDAHDILKHPTQKPMELTRRLLQSRKRIQKAKTELPKLLEELALHQVKDTFTNRKSSGKNVGKFRGRQVSLLKEDAEQLMLDA